MEDVLFTHKQRSYIVKARREGGKAVAEVFAPDGTSTNCRVDATNEVLSDMISQGYADPVRRLQEEARDAFISREP